MALLTHHPVLNTDNVNTARPVVICSEDYFRSPADCLARMQPRARAYMQPLASAFERTCAAGRGRCSVCARACQLQSAPPAARAAGIACGRVVLESRIFQLPTSDNDDDGGGTRATAFFVLLLLCRRCERRRQRAYWNRFSKPLLDVEVY